MKNELFLILDWLNEALRPYKETAYACGGTVRDYLLHREITDFDYCTTAEPSILQKAFPNGDFTFQRYGSIHTRFNSTRIDLTTMRKESKYLDFRHPSAISFTKNIEEDSWRRDFTINALYLDLKEDVIDFHKGKDDLRDGVIRFIGDPEIRVKEDPLRICRAERFALTLSFSIEEKTKKALDSYRYLLLKINPAKIKEEREKGWKGVMPSYE